MKLGAFSVSLNVKDIKKSLAFYQALGFEEAGGNIEHGYLILKNDSSTLGLFQGMFDKNMLTYNPGWDQDCSTLPEYQDVREIQSRLREKGLELLDTVDEDSAGPGSIMIVDPDGNPILIDQHI
ncbi:VOC family protein [Planctobacterium marinum]|uniref:Glyoxalase/fosfomycin resistance/dioxygenase domain-containing protein n=1 Tax=Planctobacterium marinum TaxID=1631968 RepID=A0AA48KSH4_9ALTE|nr:hypothetical protein MACH26_20050 [Planctobacterium marinum]